MPKTTKPTPKEIEACLTNKDCTAVLECHKIPFARGTTQPATTAAKATTEKCAAETAACRNDADCVKIMKTEVF